MTSQQQQQQFEKLFGPLTGFIGGGVAGAVLWKEHRVLGFLAGSGMGVVPFHLLEGNYAAAVGNLVVTGASIYTSQRWKMHPVLGFFGGMIASRLLTAAITDRVLPPKKDPLAKTVREIASK